MLLSYVLGGKVIPIQKLAINFAIMHFVPSPCYRLVTAVNIATKGDPELLTPNSTHFPLETCDTDRYSKGSCRVTGLQS